jgi:two-component system, NtrC family, response regulator
LKTVLLIDDEEKLRKLLSRIVRAEGFEVLEAGDGKSGLLKMEQHPAIDAVVCDVKLPDIHGVELTRQIKTKYPLTEVILLTAYGNIPDGVQAIKNGAFDYIIKGDDNDKILPLLHRAMEKVQLQKRVNDLEKRVGEKYSFDSMIGQSTMIQQAIEMAKKVAATDAAVLLTGETGTGKEVFAQAIHNASSRKNQSFVAVNCSALSKELLESELFGHKAGAFTGAVKDKKGLFEEAHTGTLFLDEIGEMAPELQPGLLRVLETGEFIKLGDTKTLKVNVRVIAATNRDLQKEIEAGHFRSDLYYRLSVFQIALPSLRERIQDIKALAEFFISVFAAKTNKPIPVLQKEYLEALQHYHWPGNIRELKNVIERSVILEDGGQLTTSYLPSEVQTASGGNKSNPLAAFELSSVEKLHIQKVLNYTKGNKTEAAKLLNIGLTTLYRKIEEYGLA